MAVVLKKHRFTVEEYHRMADAGVFSEDDRVELIEGEIVEMTPIGPRHAGSVDRVNRLCVTRLGDRVIVRVQNPIQLSTDSELQPDVTLLRPRADFYTESHPGPRDVFLVIEVADTSVETDRRVKLLLYSKAGIGEAWLVDLSTDRVEVCRQPTPDGYRDVRARGRGQPLTIEAFPDLALTVQDILG